MLKLLWGADWQANRAEILAQICQAEPTEKMQIWIVPEQASFEAEQLLCSHGGNSVSRFAQVLSFTRLANRVFSVCGGIARQTMDQGGRVLAMAQALEQVRSRLKLYAAGSRRPAFFPQLLSAVDEFKSYGVTSDILHQAAQQSGGQLAVKLEELALILESYNTICAGAQQDPKDRLAYLCQVLEVCDFAKNKTFYIDGFSDFTGVELRIIQQLLRSGADLTVSLCCDGLMQGMPVFESTRKTAQSLMQAASAVGQKTMARQIAESRDDEITFAARHLFAASDLQWQATATQIHLRRCGDEFDEAQAAAATVVQLLHQGYHYRNIAVAAANYPACHTIYEAVFAQYDIPVYFAGNEPVLQNPVFEMITAALEAVTGTMEQDVVLCWLKSGYSGVDCETVDILENYAITWNISGSRWASDWTSHPDGYDAKWRPEEIERMQHLNQSRRAALAPLLALREAFYNAATVGQMVKGLYTFLERLQLDVQLHDQAQRQYAVGDLQQAQKTAQLYEILISALEQMYSLLENVPVTGESFSQLFQVLLAQYNAGTIPASVDCVICGGIGDLRYHTQSALLVTGCREGLLPAYQSQSGLLSEQERTQLQSYGIELAPDAWGTLARDLVALHAVMRGAGEHLFWFSSLDQPSYLHLRMEQLFPKRLPRYESQQYPADLTNLKTFAAAALWQDAEELAPQAARMIRNASLDREMTQLQSLASYAPGDLRRGTVTGLYGKRIFLSASQIQTFASCRQAHFLQYGIKARQRVRAEFDAPIYGTFVHEVLEKTVRQVQQEGGFANVAPVRVEEIARVHIDSFTAEHCSQPEQQTQRFMYLYERNFDEIMQVIRELDQELRASSFVPERFELKFSADAAMGPVQVQGKHGTALISGAVDRVDLLHGPHGDYVRVVDYKTGHRDFDYTDLLCGMGLQMIIYLFALEENGQREFGYPVKPAGVLYFPARRNMLSLSQQLNPDEIEQVRRKDLRRQGLLLDDDYLLQAMENCEQAPKYLPYAVKKGVRTGDLADLHQLALLRNHVRRTLQQITDEIFDGNIAPNPYERGGTGACTYCPYADACHKDQNQLELRKLKAISAAEFWQELEQKEGRRHGEI